MWQIILVGIILVVVVTYSVYRIWRYFRYFRSPNIDCPSASSPLSCQDCPFANNCKDNKGNS